MERQYVATSEAGEMELTTWMRRTLAALREKGITLDASWHSVGEVYRLSRLHKIEIRRDGYLNRFGLVED